MQLLIVYYRGFVRFCSVYLFVYVCFFFFKQKTAYEMRISDWSSDVCSSDLVRIVPDENPPSVNAPSHRILVGRAEIGAAWAKQSKIGRASCRERVCQSCRSRWSPYH